MDSTVKNSIDARRQSIDMAYELTEDVKKEIDELFHRIEEFGKTCKDVMDFESKFASSSLNQEYIDMFTKVSQKCKAKEIAHQENANVKSTGQKIAEDIASDAKYLADDLTMPARRKAREEMDSKLRNTPLGKVEQAHNMFWLAKRFTKRKPKNEGASDSSREN